jgi:uncharacterized protein YfaS (alpha-2-macroglobulin family)
VAALSVIPPGETWKGSIGYPGMPGTNTALLELSRFPPLNLEKRLNYLVGYPHGCVEQTTSAVFPQLYLERIMELDSARKAEIRGNVSAGIERLTGFQTADGGFSYWPGDGEPHPWGSTYAGHFLLEARRAGFPVNEAVLKKWLQFQRNRAVLWQGREGDSGAVDQAYRLYTLALGGEAELGSMNRLREHRNLDQRAAWRLAAAYWYAGQRDAARSLARNLNLSPESGRELSGTFGSALRDKAMILETLILMGDSGRTRPLFEELSGDLSGESWLSTQETAYALIAMAPHMAASAPESLSVEAEFAGERRNFSFQSPVAQRDLGAPGGSTGNYSVQNRSAAPLYARLSVKGLPPEGEEPALAEGLALSVTYGDMKGTLMDYRSLKQGEDMTIHVTLRNSSPHPVPEIALIVPLPASWEIVNYRLGGESSARGIKYQDIRDDRVMSYFDLARGESKTVSFRVNRSFGGEYYRPAIHGYAMYDESIRALYPGGR